MILGNLTRRLLALAGGATIAAAGLVGAAAPAQAAACSGTSGVTVVVQRDGVLSTRCATGDPGSALEAFRQVGHALQADRTGLVCQVDSYPSACQSSVNAYWAFFHASAGGSWKYADVGPASYNPQPGSSVAFRFGSGAAPTVKPAAPAPAPPPTTAKPKPTTAAPKPTTTAPRTTTTAPRTTAPTSGSTSGSTVRPTGAASANPGASASTAPSASGSTPTGSPSASASSTSPSVMATSDVEAGQKPPSTGSGSSGRLVGGGVLLLALAIAVGAVALRRRQTATAGNATGVTGPLDPPQD